MSEVTAYIEQFAAIMKTLISYIKEFLASLGLGGTSTATDGE